MKRLRIRKGDNDIYTSINLTQSFDVLEYLTLRLTPAQIYQRYSSNYGVIAGRVLANRGFGIPNAKVSLFIPIDDVDKENPIISGIYPFTTPDTKTIDGLRYNLLEKESQSNCHIAVGSFPSKREILDTPIWIDIVDKYYKYTTTTNESGDYMLFGVPLGVQLVHMDVDLSDIGYLSVKPYNLINAGANPNQFLNSTQFKGGSDLDNLIQVQTINSTIDVQPFWSNLNTNEITINKLDFNLNGELIPTAMFFGSIFTDSKNGMINLGCKPRAKSGLNCGLTTGKGVLEMVRRINKQSNYVEYVNIPESGQIDENGAFATLIEMNLDRVVTDEFGKIVLSEDPNIGIPTTAQVRFRASLEESRFDIKRRTAFYLIPNMHNRYDFGGEVLDSDLFEVRWNKIYTTTNFIPRYQRNDRQSSSFFTGIKNIGECETNSPFPYNRLDVDFNAIFTILCVYLTIFEAIATVLDSITGVFFQIFKLICLIQYPFDADKRMACRCYGCRSIYGGVEPIDWSATEIDCANAYAAYLDDDDNPIPNNCDGAACDDCDNSFFNLQCGGNGYGNVSDLFDCYRQQLANTFNVATYEFYNDWVIGSLYAPRFKYRLRTRRSLKTVERFCDYDCREQIGSTSGDPHYKNRCNTCYIVDKDFFDTTNSGNILLAGLPHGRGVINEDGNLLYYSARHDVPNGQPIDVNLTVADKRRLLFATNMIEVGSKTKCDFDGEPYLVDSLESTSYQAEDSVETLYATNTCVDITNINTVGITLMSQTGIDIPFAELSHIGTAYEGADEEIYTLNGSVANLPDYSGAIGAILFDRVELNLRRNLCEKFNYFNTVGVYSVLARPVGGDSYFTDSDGDILETITDSCLGYDTLGNPMRNMPPYYTYFGLIQGKTGLDKLKQKYFNPCVD